MTVFLLFLLVVRVVEGFYLPGVAPHDYAEGEKVEVVVNALTSGETVLPYDYYHALFPFCKPSAIHPIQESLGSILFGDRLFNSPFSLSTLANSSCSALCSVSIQPQSAVFTNNAIRNKYCHNWIIDGLPAAYKLLNEVDHYSTIGFPIGLSSNDNLFFHNHYNFYINYNQESKNSYRIVGIQIHPQSIQSTSGPSQTTSNNCNNPPAPLSLSETEITKVAFSYSVYWIPSSSHWNTRWDHYLFTTDAKIHWFSVVNSATVVFLLSGMVFMILARALNRDIARYNQIEAQEDSQEEFGWKIIHGDVFRAPYNRMLFSVLLGNGSQLLLMAAVTIVFAALGFLSPSSRGSLATVMIVFYFLFGSVAGYTSARFYKLFGGEAWRQNVLMTAFLIPGSIFVIFIFLNFFLIAAQSSAAVPFTTIIAVILLWFLVSAPLSLIGAYFGFKKPKINLPVRTNQIPRQIPDQPSYLRTFPIVFLGGILPFGAVFIELYFILNSIWSNHVYYVFGFLMLVFAILIMTCSLVSILICYFQLCAENYHWWWRSFLTSASSSIYMFIYSIFYYKYRLQLTGVSSSVLYYGCTLIMCMVFGVVTGSVGVIATFMFVKRIYGAIKVD